MILTLQYTMYFAFMIMSKIYLKQAQRFLTGYSMEYSVGIKYIICCSPES